MITILAISEGVLFGIGGVIFIAVFTAALALAYARFEELGERDERAEVRRAQASASERPGGPRG